MLPKDSALVGFRERASNFLAELNECHILDKRIGFELKNLKALITDLNARDSIPQLEIAMGRYCHVPDSIKSVAVIVRHMQELDDEDLAKLRQFLQLATGNCSYNQRSRQRTSRRY